MNLDVMDAALAVAALPVALPCAYLAALTALSRRMPSAPGVAPRLRFAVVVPAHDEERAVGATVTSLRAMSYPPELVDVIVVADNCADATAARAAEAGARVLVRRDPARRGKGHALAYAFDRILAQGRADAVVVVDADSVASRGLCSAFASHLERGAEVLQADYAVKNARRAWRPALLAIAFGAAHRLRSRARERLGLSVGLRGNGMCFRASVLREVPHDAVSLVEDLEFGIRLAEAGKRVEYVPEARVAATMPEGETASRAQRLRWEHGRGAMVRAHGAKLLARGFKDRVALDLALDLLVPPLATLALWAGLGLVVSALWAAHAGHVFALAVWAACGLALLLHVLRGWQLSATGTRGLAALGKVPAYIAWKLLLKVREPCGPHAWVRTPREGEGT